MRHPRRSHVWCKKLPLWKESIPPASVLILTHLPTDRLHAVSQTLRCLGPAFSLATSGSHSLAPTSTSKMFSCLSLSSLLPDPVEDGEEHTPD